MRREIRDQRDLLATEGLDLLAIDCNGANQVVVLQHRYAEICSGAAELGRRALQPICLGDILDVHELLGLDQTLHRAARMRSEFPATAKMIGKGRRHAHQRFEREKTVLEFKHGSESSVTDTGGVLQHGLEHWVQLAG